MQDQLFIKVYKKNITKPKITKIIVIKNNETSFKFLKTFNNWVLTGVGFSVFVFAFS